MRIKYEELVETAQMGITELECEALGKCTFVGLDKHKNVIVELEEDGNIVSLPELEFNMRNFEKVFEPETHVRYITEGTLARLNDEYVEPGGFNIKPSPLHTYKAVLTITRAWDNYNGLPERD